MCMLYLIRLLFFVIPVVAKKFNCLPYILHQPFLVSTTVEESVVAKRVYQNCPISLPNRVSYVDLVELDMSDFVIILGMDCLHACFASIGCRTGVVRFNFPNEPVFEWKRGILLLEVVLFLVLNHEKRSQKVVFHI